MRWSLAGGVVVDVVRGRIEQAEERGDESIGTEVLAELSVDLREDIFELRAEGGLSREDSILLTVTVQVGFAAGLHARRGGLLAGVVEPAVGPVAVGEQHARVLGNSAR